MTRYVRLVTASLMLIWISLVASACKDKGKPVSPAQLPDLNEQTRPYVTVETTKVRAGPGTQFRAIAEIGRDAKVNVVGKDGDWVTKETLNPSAEGKYEAVTDTQVRSGPGLHYPVVANIAKGTKLNVVEEEKGWLKVESKRGNKPGYVEASLAKPATEQ
jgi:uncharacterized protein YgiM (DUF1202 family)